MARSTSLITAGSTPAFVLARVSGADAVRVAAFVPVAAGSLDAPAVVVMGGGTPELRRVPLRSLRCHETPGEGALLFMETVKEFGLMLWKA
jgi:hypothetical protein